MAYGGITFEHVIGFQIKIMMGNQYSRLLDAMRNDDEDEIIVACLRLGWNDAFRHVSKNIPDADIISECKKQGMQKLLKARKDGTQFIDDSTKDAIIVEICSALCEDFKGYANKKSTSERHAFIREKMTSPKFKNHFAAIKVIDPDVHANYLCFGHIQKLFNMAIKLYLCLKICAEEANKHGLRVNLQYGAAPVTFKAELFNLFDEETFSADCPIDHYILESIDSEVTSRGSAHTPVKPRSQNAGFKKFGSIAWSKINSTNDADYIDIQNEIALLQRDTGKCNLCFDFENWNS